MSHSDDYMICQVCEFNEIDLCCASPGPDSGIYTCEKAHIFCEHCFPEFHEKMIDNGFDIEVDDECEVVKEICPICQREHVTDADMVKYLLKKFNVTKKEIKKEMQKELS